MVAIGVSDGEDDQKVVWKLGKKVGMSNAFAFCAPWVKER
jgi:hypothetical protein